MWLWKSTALIICLTPCISFAKQGVLTNCAQLAAAVRDQQTTHVSFSLRATVSYCNHAPSSYVGLGDNKGAIYFWVTSDISVSPGDYVCAKGHAIRNKLGYVDVFCHTISILKHGDPPKPVAATAARIESGNLDFHLVKVCGVIRDAFEDDVDNVFIGLSLLCDGVPFYITAPKDTTNSLCNAKNLIGADVTVTGICEPRPHPSRKHVGRSIFIGTLNDIVRTSRNNNPNIPFIRELDLKNPATIARQGYHRTDGTVLAKWGMNNLILLNTDNQVVHAKLKTSVFPSIGQTISAIGFPETDLYHINLSQAEWSPATLPQANTSPVTNISANVIYHQGTHESITPTFHGQLVRIRGIVRHFPNPSEAFNYVSIESDGYLIPVYSNADTLQRISLGSTIEATGICVNNIENWSPNAPLPRITGFFVVTRSSEDIVVVARPSWWTPARLLAVIGGLVALIVVILVWNVSLRVLAERRGRALFKARIGNATAKLKVEERTHLAIELHDTIAQNLTGVSMELESAADLGEGASPEMRHHLNIAMKALKSCREELRHCLFDLRSQALEEPNFKVAVEKTLQPHLNGAKLAVRFNVPRKELHDNTAQALLRAIRELAVNAIRHGKATSIKVAGELDADGLRCSVRDNGCGFDPDTCPGVLQGHFGLQGVRERIEGLGGTFDISSTPGKGTKAVITVFSPKVTDEQNS